MKTRNLRKFITANALIACFLFAGCSDSKQKGTYVVKNIKLQQVGHVEKGDSTPRCRLTLDINYLEPQSETDTLAQKVNHLLQVVLMGMDHGQPMEIAVDSFVRARISNWKDTIADAYQTDIAAGTKAEDMPGWYSRDYRYTSEIYDGKEGILCMKIVRYDYTGGAYPYEYQGWVNYDKQTGKRLTMTDILGNGAERNLSPILLQKVIDEVSRRVGDSNIKTMEDLHKYGVLMDNDMYISPNLLLEKDKVSLHYNAYDIGTFAMGPFDFTLTYDQVQDYFDR